MFILDAATLVPLAYVWNVVPSTRVLEGSAEYEYCHRCSRYLYACACMGVGIQRLLSVSILPLAAMDTLPYLYILLFLALCVIVYLCVTFLLYGSSMHIHLTDHNVSFFFFLRAPPSYQSTGTD